MAFPGGFGSPGMPGGAGGNAGLSDQEQQMVKVVRAHEHLFTLNLHPAAKKHAGMVRYLGRKEG